MTSHDYDFPGHMACSWSRTSFNSLGECSISITNQSCQDRRSTSQTTNILELKLSLQPTHDLNQCKFHLPQPPCSGSPSQRRGTTSPPPTSVEAARVSGSQHHHNDYDNSHDYDFDCHDTTTLHSTSEGSYGWSPKMIQSPICLTNMCG